MNFGPQEEMRKLFDSICILGSIVEPFSFGKGFDIGFFIVRDSEFSIKSKCGGDSIEN